MWYHHFNRIQFSFCIRFSIWNFIASLLSSCASIFLPLNELCKSVFHWVPVHWKHMRHFILFSTFSWSYALVFGSSFFACSHFSVTFVDRIAKDQNSIKWHINLICVFVIILQFSFLFRVVSIWFSVSGLDCWNINMLSNINLWKLWIWIFF